MELFDCAVIGAGSAGLSASLILGRSRKKVALFDNGTNRNRVTQESHGFLTRDGIKPAEFKEIALSDIKKYPSVHFYQKTVMNITKQPNGLFKIETLEDVEYVAQRIILATGVQEEFPSIPNIKKYYGKSLFSCPTCDGWELRDKPLIIISEDEEQTLFKGKLVYNWSKDLVIATNGHELSVSTLNELQGKDITVITEPIQKLNGKDGYLNKVVFSSGLEIERVGGFIVPNFTRPNQFAEQLGCKLNENGSIMMDVAGRTSQENVYAAGETAKLGQSSLIIAAAEGYKAAMTIVFDSTI
ncbi:thioredoxin reductase [Bacillus thuringiensis]|uniref:NAD(P)/FAD-dependent oxidoreductase n=1 Tax=Bacillus cereus group TaxID=86661 RepID=UPI0013752091|nr:MULTISPECIES: NAD(P)/FAD-dependent oxidoreductase [Bacillus cereus group]MBG9465136.1 thioredoxin reductase [Bacillus thuringiensis]